MHRVQKLLSNWGYCSRRKAEALIANHRVKVNGTLISLGDKATEEDTITVDGKPVQIHRKIYVKFYKPKGCVTAATDSEHKTVMEYIKIKERVFPVGRLDYNTTGLLLLTNDGDFANNVMHPRYEIKKTYKVAVQKPLRHTDMLKLMQGVKLDDGKTAPAKVEMITPSRFNITIHEGKNRIIRRMLEKLGYTAVALKRTHIGKVSLGTMTPKSFRVQFTPFRV